MNVSLWERMPSEKKYCHGLYFSLPPDHLTKTNSQLILWINYYTLGFWKASHIFSSDSPVRKTITRDCVMVTKANFKQDSLLKLYVFYLIKIKLKI